MTLLVDRRKDNYDELLVLARDARLQRARANRWTTGLVAIGMAGTAYYVASMNQQVEDLRETARAAETARDKIENERNALRAEIDTLQRFQNHYAEIGPTTNLGDSISELAESLPPRVVGPTPSTTPSTTPQSVEMSVVWFVDGSRRFPVTDEDILWVPEGGFWLQLKRTEGGGGRQLLRTTMKPGTESTAGVPLARIHREAIAPTGTSDCVEVELHASTRRASLRNLGYVDVEITYFKASTDQPCSMDAGTP